MANVEILQASLMPPLVYGWMDNALLSDALFAAMPFLPDDCVAVIRSLDSAMDADSLSRALEFDHIQFDVVSGNVVVGGQALRKAAAFEEWFSGFDEVWIFAKEAPRVSLRPLPGLCSDRVNLSQDPLPADVQRAFLDSTCLLALADGCGLNVVCLDETIQRAIGSMYG